MRMYVPMALALATAAWAQAPATPPSASDPVLESLIREALDRSPDLARSANLIAAEKERIPQARALPDPTVSVGIQNDGFDRITVGEPMMDSYYQLMVTQPFYGPGKRRAKAEVARLGAEVAEAAVGRERLTLKADVKRAYYGLLLVRDQKRLLEVQAPLLEQAEAIARTRYQVGQGSQADLLRAQLARTRLVQTRLSLDSEERTTLAGLNRLRAMQPDTPVPTTRVFAQIPDPAPIAVDAAVSQQSPELAVAQASVRQAEKSLELAKVNRRPDFSVTAGVMPREPLDPMWTFSVGVTVPLWAKNKQQRAVAEQELRRQAQGSQVEGLGHLLKERTADRAARMDSALALLKLYREGLLVQSEGAFRASLAQYETGKAPFTSVLESLNGWIADQSGLLQTQAQAQAIAIAQEELALGPVPPIGATGLSAVSMGIGASASPMGAAKAGASSAPVASDGGSTSMSAM